MLSADHPAMQHRPLATPRPARLCRSASVCSALALGLFALCACTTTPPSVEDTPHKLVGAPLALVAADLRADGVVDVAELRGQVVIVDFWASWCAPCRQSLPFYQRLATTHRQRGLQVLGVSVDVERALAERFLQEVPTTFPMTWDANQRLAAQLEIATMPTALFVDRAGTVRAVHEGFVDSDQASIEALIERLLAEPAPAQVPPASPASPASPAPPTPAET